MQKVVLITGASSGIGKLTAEYLSQQGFRVYGLSRSAPENVHFEVLRMDVNDRKSVQEVVQRIVAEEGRIDIVLNNAGYSLTKPLENLEEEEIEGLLQTNFYGVMRLCQATLPIMKKQGSGLILNVSSLAGLFAVPFLGAYSISKFAMEAYSEGLYMEMKRYGIDVSVINPGSVKTNIIANQKQLSAEELRDFRDDYVNYTQKRREDQNAGLPPEAFSKLVHKIITNPKRKFRYFVAKPKQRLAYYIKRYISFEAFASLFMNYYKVSK